MSAASSIAPRPRVCGVNAMRAYFDQFADCVCEALDEVLAVAA